MIQKHQQYTHIHNDYMKQKPTVRIEALTRAQKAKKICLSRRSDIMILRIVDFCFASSDRVTRCAFFFFVKTANTKIVLNCIGRNVTYCNAVRYSSGVLVFNSIGKEKKTRSIDSQPYFTTTLSYLIGRIERDKILDKGFFDKKSNSTVVFKDGFFYY